jgi:hypothetical protein
MPDVKVPVTSAAPAAAAPPAKMLTDMVDKDLASAKVKKKAKGKKGLRVKTKSDNTGLQIASPGDNSKNLKA